jgi:hypothetical protein
MRRYYIKCGPDRIEYLDVIEENSEGYLVRITKMKDGYERVIKKLLSRRFFNVCVKTGYIYPAEKAIPFGCVAV